MKKISSVLILLSALLALSACGKERMADPAVPPTLPAVTQPSVPTEPVQTQPAPTEAPLVPVSLEDALFIGDSRTVGLMEYSQIPADYFANVGMSVYNVSNKLAPIRELGNISLRDLLAKKTYGKIYIMLGINEIGYNLDKTAAKYENLVSQIRQAQPNAPIFIQANLHVSRKKSESHSYLKNDALDRLNKLQSQLAVGENIYYLDANSLFDDGSGALSPQYTPDGIHLQPSACKDYMQWIALESARAMR